MTTTVCDFSRSFLTFRLDFERKPPFTVTHQPPYSLNNARIQLESVCWVTDKASNQRHRFLLGASCKTERVGVERDVWTEPNADFAPIFAADRFMNLKTFARAGVEVERYPPGSGQQSDRQTGVIEEIFDDFNAVLGSSPALRLESGKSIVEATLENAPLVARTEIENERYLASIEYPVKTMNANERDIVYQTDTGPILWPDLTREPADLLTGFDLAFSAFNGPDWVEVLLRVPTEIAPSVSVYHYSKSVRADVRNHVFRIL